MTECHRMLMEIARTARDTAWQTGTQRFSESVMCALRKIPRDHFVPRSLSIEAYDNTALPIGYEQTISQPYIVALMTDMLALSPEHRCLEVGTGSGYQAAVLSRLVHEVHSMEIIAPLCAKARQRLQRLGYVNVHVHLGNGHQGYPEAAPFDRIMVTAAAEKIPEALIEQLSLGGRMVIPIGPAYGDQTLYRVDKDPEGDVSTQALLAVRFVPLIAMQSA